MFIQHTGELLHRSSRIVSLVPSQTELLFDLGLYNAIVGITKFCVHPAELRKTKAIIGGTKKLHIEKIKALNPDLIIANKEENTKEEIGLLAENFPVWVTDIETLKDAFNMIKEMGELTGTQPRAAEIIRQVRNNFTQINSIEGINTCYLIWQDPFMTVGKDTFVNDMMQHCGFKNIFRDKKRYPIITIEDIKERNCELVLLASEPYPFKQKHLEQLKARLPAVKILLADGEFFSWYGSRLLQAPFYFNTLIKQLN